MDIIIIIQNQMILAFPSVCTVHLLPTAVVHGLLLLFQLSNTFANCHAVWNGTRLGLALTGMNLKQGPYSFANVATTSCLDGALCTMLQKTLHLGAVRRGTLGRTTSGGMK